MFFRNVYYLDSNRGRDTTQEFQDINRAYEVLSNPKLRENYDVMGERGIGTSAMSDEQTMNYNSKYSSHSPFSSPFSSPYSSSTGYGSYGGYGSSHGYGYGEAYSSSYSPSSYSSRSRATSSNYPSPSSTSDPSDYSYNNSPSTYGFGNVRGNRRSSSAPPSSSPQQQQTSYSSYGYANGYEEGDGYYYRNRQRNQQHWDNGEGEASRAGFPEKGTDIKLDFEIDLQTSIFGGEKEITITHLERCPSCKGYDNQSYCNTCNGHGRVSKTKNVTLIIPSGVNDGSRIFVKGEGNAGKNGGLAGDLYVYLKLTCSEEEFSANFPGYDGPNTDQYNFDNDQNNNGQSNNNYGDGSGSSYYDSRQSHNAANGYTASPRRGRRKSRDFRKEIFHSDEDDYSYSGNSFSSSGYNEFGYAESSNGGSNGFQGFQSDRSYSNSGYTGTSDNYQSAGGPTSSSSSQHSYSGSSYGFQGFSSPGATFRKGYGSYDTNDKDTTSASASTSYSNNSKETYSTVFQREATSNRSSSTTNNDHNRVYTSKKKSTPIPTPSPASSSSTYGSVYSSSKPSSSSSKSKTTTTTNQSTSTTYSKASNSQIKKDSTFSDKNSKTQNKGFEDAYTTNNSTEGSTPNSFFSTVFQRETPKTTTSNSKSSDDSSTTTNNKYEQAYSSSSTNDEDTIDSKKKKEKPKGAREAFASWFKGWATGGKKDMTTDDKENVHAKKMPYSFSGFAHVETTSSSTVGYEEAYTNNTEFASSKPTVGNDLMFQLEIDHNTSILGGIERVRISHLETCTKCNGTGIATAHQSHHQCSDCDGCGTIAVAKNIKVTIPAGIKDGNKLRAKGEGDAGLHGGPHGDLYILIKVKAKEGQEKQKENTHDAQEIKVSTSFDPSLSYIDAPLPLSHYFCAKETEGGAGEEVF